jgi:diketogulonate reductase-like aldo/keto reductase
LEKRRENFLTGSDSVISAYGVCSPRIIYGTAWKKQQTEVLVKKAIDCGFRGIDTACQPKHYNEAGVGAAVVAGLHEGFARADLYLQTKFTPFSGHDPQQVPYDPNVPLAEQVAQSFAVSLRNLQTNYLDCLVLHSPLETPRDTREVWQAMQTIFDAGGARQLGISNCYMPAQLADLYRWARIKPAVVQNRFYADSGYDVRIRAFCREHHIIYQSFWTLTANGHVLADQKILELARRYACTPAQILFRYLTQVDIVPLTGTTSEGHMRADLAIFGFELTIAECASVTALFE